MTENDALSSMWKLSPRRNTTVATQVDELVDALIRGSVPPGAESLAPLLIPELEPVLGFLPEDALVIADNDYPGAIRHDEMLWPARRSEQGLRAGPPWG